MARRANGVNEVTDISTARQPSLIARDDTILGICEALGEDFGFNPLWLRVAFAVTLLINPVAVVATYFACGAVVLLTRMIAPNPRRPAARPKPPLRRPRAITTKPARWPKRPERSPALRESSRNRGLRAPFLSRAPALWPRASDLDWDRSPAKAGVETGFPPSRERGTACGRAAFAPPVWTARLEPGRHRIADPARLESDTWRRRYRAISSSRCPRAPPIPPRRSARRSASAASTSWNSARRSTPRRRTSRRTCRSRPSSRSMRIARSASSPRRRRRASS